MSNIRVYTATVAEDGDDFMIQFPPEMLDNLGWKEGDTIVWDVDEETGVITARKEKTTE